MSMLNRTLFERPQAELHTNYRGLDRDSFFRHQNTAKLANLTTAHSNVFIVRLTTSYFVVDPTTGAVREEYVDETGEPVRARATYIIDRSVPVGFLRGKAMNNRNAVLYEAIED